MDQVRPPESDSNRHPTSDRRGRFGSADKRISAVASDVLAEDRDGGADARRLGGNPLVAPHLMWSEATSVLHELRWRKEISNELAGVARERLATARISPRRPKGLIDEASRIADRLGWAKTYDAEYVALASLLKCGLLTTDAKLQDAASKLVG